ncbi:unnamed protein product [Orchesella dallaii]|uniref:C2H2-type domain-containing protein n=1 Tax=Orchesella dallaii TaxID=48710 RepID=A0ABP1RHR2_9HEXA
MNPVHTCPVCKKNLKGSVTVLRNHIRTHSRNPHVRHSCPICHAKFLDPHGVSRHIKRIHDKEPKHLCKVCGKAFHVKRDLPSHMILHQVNRDFKCEFCAKGFPSRGGLKKHLKNHSGIKPFSCVICLRQFKTQINLFDHIRRHTKEKPFECHICGKCYALKLTRKKHLLIAHGTDRNYPCEICGKRFKGRKGLQAHIIRHLGEKSHECSVCSNCFYTKSELKSHMGAVLARQSMQQWYYPRDVSSLLPTNSRRVSRFNNHITWTPPHGIPSKYINGRRHLQGNAYLNPRLWTVHRNTNLVGRSAGSKSIFITSIKLSGFLIVQNSAAVDFCSEADGQPDVCKFKNCYYCCSDDLCHINKLSAPDCFDRRGFCDNYCQDWYSCVLNGCSYDPVYKSCIGRKGGK